VQSFCAGSRLPAHVPCDLLFKNRSQIVPDGGIIVDYKNTNHASPPRPEYDSRIPLIV
jgi:hypothetical protein